MDEAEETTSTTSGADTEMQQVLGLFDLPAFARRGQELEHSLARLDQHCRRERGAMLEMVRLRLRQWASASEGPEAWQTIFTAPLDPLWTLCEAEPPVWSGRPSHRRRQRAIARDLIASIERFNRRWTEYLETLKLERINFLIDQYNRYYVLEKECILSSVRLAARNFTPKSPVTSEQLFELYPILPVPLLLG